MRVLVIEDEEKISNFVRKELETQGCAVTIEENGEDGFKQAALQTAEDGSDEQRTYKESLDEVQRLKSDS